MSLRVRIHLLTAILALLSAVASWFTLSELAEKIVEQWGMRYAEKQVLYDKMRTLQPILREVALSRRFAESPVMRAWVRSPEDGQLARAALAEMEKFRPEFSDRNYFFALRKSGRYYYNNAADEFAGNEWRYTLDTKKPADRWFYSLIEQDRTLHLNVSPDANLSVTKLWINVLVREGGQVLGVAGTGLDLSRFIREVVDTAQPGITSLFVDQFGSIQLYRDQSLIDFGSITRTDGRHKSLNLLIPDTADQGAIYGAMKELEMDRGRVISRLVHIGGKRHLAGIAYLPEIGWYEITLLDLDVLLPLSSFSGMALVFGLTLVLALVLFNLVLSRWILNPLKALEKGMDELQQGRRLPDTLLPGGQDEIGRLMGHFKDMAQAVWAARSELEAKVRERTEALETLSKTDSLTHMLNRRGMAERIETEISRCAREGGRFGILCLDVDDFKQINDRHGHPVGDQALLEVANQIRALIRPYDCAARWGGDEFLVLLQGANEAILMALGERIRSAVADASIPDITGGAVHLSVSLGGTLSGGGEARESLLQNADIALYAAKAAGRNCLRFHGAQVPGSASAPLHS